MRIVVRDVVQADLQLAKLSVRRIAHGDRFSEVGAQQIPSGLPIHTAPQRFEDSWSYYQSNDLNASRVRSASGLAPIFSKATKARVK